MGCQIIILNIYMGILVRCTNALIFSCPALQIIGHSGYRSGIFHIDFYVLLTCPWMNQNELYLINLWI